MDTEYNILYRFTRWLRRFRKRRGYGVHSPYAFDFITGVIYNAETYYAYDQLRRSLPYSLSRLDEYDPESGLTAKDLRLLFRLANFQEASTILLQGASSTVAAYLQAARTTATFLPVPSAADVDAPIADLVYYDQAPAALAPGRMTIVRGIHRDAAARRQWQTLCQHPAVTLTFDLGRFGITLYVAHLTRQHYTVNYL